MVNENKVIQSYLTTYASFDCASLKEEITSFKEPYTVGETLLILLSELKDTSTEKYFEILWYAARSLTPYFDYEVSDFTEETIRSILSTVSKSKATFMKRWIHWIIDYHKPKEKEEKKKRNDNIQFIQDLSFPKDYIPTTDITFSELFSYWLFLHKEEYKYEYMSGTLLPAYRSLESFHSIPFKDIRLSDIRQNIAPKTKAKQNRDLFLFRKLEQFAYEQKIIYYIQTAQVKMDSLPPRTQETLQITKAQMDALLQNTNDSSVALTVTLLLTGMKLRELFALKEEDMNHQLQSLPEKAHPALTIAYSTIQSYEARDYRYSYKKILVEQAVKETGLQYFNLPLTPTKCRYSNAMEVLYE